MLDFIGTLVILALLVLIVVGVAASAVLYHMSRHTRRQH
jgi:type II secretory pathway pseudopilin PulG